MQADREGLRVKGNTNIQVNGNVYGGIHVNGGGQPVACLPPGKPQQGDHAAIDFSWVWMLAKGLGWLTVGAFALVGAIGLFAAALVVTLGMLGAVIGFWAVCRLCSFVLFVEAVLDGGPTRPVLVPHVVNGVRELATGERVNELQSTEMTRYVD